MKKVFHVIAQLFKFKRNWSSSCTEQFIRQTRHRHIKVPSLDFKLSNNWNILPRSVETREQWCSPILIINSQFPSSYFWRKLLIIHQPVPAAPCQRVMLAACRLRHNLWAMLRSLPKYIMHVNIQSYQSLEIRSIHQKLPLHLILLSLLLNKCYQFLL